MRKQVLQLTIEMPHLQDVSFRADDLGSISPMPQISLCAYAPTKLIRYCPEWLGILAVIIFCEIVSMSIITCHL